MTSFILNLLNRWPCHRIAERCFTICNYKIPICSRCFGILLGMTIGLPVSMFGGFDTKWKGAFFMIPAFIDIILQERGISNSNNIIRFSTGIMAGIGAIIFILLYIKDDVTLILRMM
ncbi:MAG: DUF2085 domain-containing protein [Desulfobaccales bacterium]